MTELEFLKGIDWPGAFTVVGSVVTVVGGLLAAYATYLKATDGNGKMRSNLPSPENVQIHSRISGVRDKVAELEGEQKVLMIQIDNLRKSLKEHDARDVDDFKTINTKVDKLMEIIVEMLQADR